MMAVKNRKQAIALKWMWLRWMTSVRAWMDMVEVGDEHLRSNRHGGGGWQAFEPVEVGDKRLCSNRHGGGRWQAFKLEWTQWRWGCLGSNGHNRGGRRAFRLDLRWWRWETSICAWVDMVEVMASAWAQVETGVWARMDTVEVGDKRLCLNRHGGGGWQVFELEWTWWRWSGLGLIWGDGGGRQAPGLEWTWWRWEMSIQAWLDKVEAGDEQLHSNMVEVDDECLGLDWHIGGGKHIEITCWNNL